MQESLLHADSAMTTQMPVPLVVPASTSPIKAEPMATATATATAVASERAAPSAHAPTEMAMHSLRMLTLPHDDYNGATNTRSASPRESKRPARFADRGGFGADAVPAPTSMQQQPQAAAAAAPSRDIDASPSKARGGSGSRSGGGAQVRPLAPLLELGPRMQLTCVLVTPAQLRAREPAATATAAAASGRATTNKIMHGYLCIREVQTKLLDPLPQYKGRTPQSSRSSIRQELEKLHYAPLVANKEELAVFKDRGIIKQNAPGTSLYTVRQMVNFLKYHDLESRATQLADAWAACKAQHGFESCSGSSSSSSSGSGSGSGSRSVSTASDNGSVGETEQGDTHGVGSNVSSLTTSANNSSNNSVNGADSEDEQPLQQRHNKIFKQKQKMAAVASTPRTPSASRSNPSSSPSKGVSALAARRRVKPRPLDSAAVASTQPSPVKAVAVSNSAAGASIEAENAIAAHLFSASIQRASAWAAVVQAGEQQRQQQSQHEQEQLHQVGDDSTRAHGTQSDLRQLSSSGDSQHENANAIAQLYSGGPTFAQRTLDQPGRSRSQSRFGGAASAVAAAGSAAAVGAGHRRRRSSSRFSSRGQLEELQSPPLPLQRSPLVSSRALFRTGTEPMSRAQRSPTVSWDSNSGAAPGMNPFSFQMTSAGAAATAAARPTHRREPSPGILPSGMAFEAEAERAYAASASFNVLVHPPPQHQPQTYMQMQMQQQQMQQVHLQGQMQMQMQSPPHQSLQSHMSQPPRPRVWDPIKLVMSPTASFVGSSAAQLQPHSGGLMEPGSGRIFGLGGGAGFGPMSPLSPFGPALQVSNAQGQGQGQQRGMLYNGIAGATAGLGSVPSAAGTAMPMCMSPQPPLGGFASPFHDLTSGPPPLPPFAVSGSHSSSMGGSTAGSSTHHLHPPLHQQQGYKRVRVGSMVSVGGGYGALPMEPFSAASNASATGSGAAIGAGAGPHAALMQDTVEAELASPSPLWSGLTTRGSAGTGAAAAAGSSASPQPLNALHSPMLLDLHSPLLGTPLHTTTTTTTTTTYAHPPLAPRPTHGSTHESLLPAPQKLEACASDPSSYAFGSSSGSMPLPQLKVERADGSGLPMPPPLSARRRSLSVPAMSFGSLSELISIAQQEREKQQHKQMAHAAPTAQVQ